MHQLFRVVYDFVNDKYKCLNSSKLKGIRMTIEITDNWIILEVIYHWHFILLEYYSDNFQRVILMAYNFEIDFLSSEI